MADYRVQFRVLDPMKKDLEERTRYMDERQTTALFSETARRDLERYYAGINAALYDINLTYGEAMLIVDALNGYLMTPEVPYLMVHNVADAIQMDRLDTKWEIDGKALIEKLSKLSPLECLAINDAVERWWNATTYHVSEEQESFEQRCIRVGLIRPKRNSLLAPESNS